MSTNEPRAGDEEVRHFRQYALSSSFSLSSSVFLNENENENEDDPPRGRLSELRAESVPTGAPNR